MFIVAKNPFFKEVVQHIREVMPEISAQEATIIAEGGRMIGETQVEQILARMSVPDEMCELR